MANNNENIIRIGYVVDTYDEYDGGRIKARLFPDDDGKSTEELPYAFPLLPKMVHVMPKKDEAVLIISPKLGDNAVQRYYLGPIIHQPQFMGYDDFFASQSLMDSGNVANVLPALSRNTDAKGALCSTEDISIKGRGDTDIIFKEKETLLRCGVRLTDRNNSTNILFNKTNPTYVKLKYHEDKLNDGTKSTATIVSEKINLISTNSRQYFNVQDNKELITDEVMNKIIEDAHVLPYGDTLVEFLELFIRAFSSHTHAYPGLPPIPNMDYTSLMQYDLNDILSESVRIN